MACKYTYGGQEYDSLDDLKAAVKNDLQRSADKENVQSRNTGKGNFLGYVRSENGVPFSSAGKGKPEGDGKDKAMRKVANAGFIGELSLDGTQGSSTLTSFFGSSTGDPSVNMDNKNPLQARIYDGSSTNYSIYNVSEIPDSNYPVILVRNNGSNASMFGWTRGVVMLARNGKLSGKPLKDKTKKEILDAHNVGARFVVGDMPGVDTQFIDYLNEIGATYKVYTTNSEGTEFDRSGSSGQSYRNMLKSNIVDNINQSNTAEQSSNVKGENISSTGSTFAKQLTNPGNNLTVKYKDNTFRNAEHAYQTWKSGTFDQAAFNSTAFIPRGNKPAYKNTNYTTMVEILTAKLVQHPELIAGIDQRGGLVYIQNSTHIVKGDAYWESSGQNKFIQALADAYRAVKNTDDLPIQFRYNIPNANAVQKELKLPSDSRVLAVARIFKSIVDDVQKEDAYEGIVKPYLSKKTTDLVSKYFKGGFQHWAGKSPEHIAMHVKLSKDLNESMLNDYIKYLQDNGWKKGLEPYSGEIPYYAYSVPTSQGTSSQQSNTTQQPKTTVTDVEVEAMTKALVEMYPEIEFGVENNPNFVDKEGVFNQRIENEMDRDYWRDLYRNTYTKNQQEFRLMSIPTIADKYEPDTEHVYHGTKNYKIDSEGNLILVPSENYSGKTTSISFTQIPVVAQDYMIRKRGNIIIKIDNDVLGDDYEVESAEEIAVNGNKLFIVPKGKYTIITVPRLNELREVEVGKQIDKKANKLLSTISDDLALLDTIYAAQIEAKNYSEFQEQTDNPNKIVDSLYLDERYVASAAGTQIYEQVASKVDKQWIITALSNKLIDDIENTGKTISNIEDALWDMSRYGEDYAPHTSNLFEELLNHIGLGYNAAFGVSENATKESILLQQEKQKEREEIVDKIEELVNKADEKALAVYNSEEEVAKRKERKLLRDTARAKYLSLAENQVKQEMPDDLPFQKIQKDGKSKIIGQADIQARKVLIDAAFKHKPDLVSHEFAHHYIAWFRNTPLVQQGIKMYGSEEALVQAIGEQAVVQRGKAWSWWKKFVAWLLNSANDVSDLTKENLRDILTDAFLSRQDLNKQAGTEAGVKLEKNVAVLNNETYLWNDKENMWNPFDRDNPISHNDSEMKRLMQEERDAVKNDATMNFYQEDFDKMEAAGLIQFKNMYGDAKTFRYNKTSDAWYDVTSDNRSSVRTDIEAIEYEWYSAIEAADSYSWKNNTMQQLQNKQLNIHKSIALNRVNRYNLLATINTSITNDITSVLDISAKQKNSGAVVDPKTNIIAAITMVGSKQGVGNMANAISGRSVLMPINAHTEPSFYYSVGDEVVKNKPLPVYLAPFGITEELFINDDGEEDLAYSFGSLVDSQIRSVMFHLSEYLTLQVDAVKDPVAVALGYIKANLNLVSYLCSLGVTPERIAQFLAEPGSSGTQVNRNNVITVWHDATESNENSFHKGKFFKTYKPSDYDGRSGYTTTTFIEKSNYKLKMEFVDNELKKSSTYKGVDVKQAYINKIVDGGRELAYHLNYEAIIRDGVDLLAHPALKILYYWDLIEQAKQYAKSVKIINADGHHSKSMNNAVEHQNNVREQIDNPKASVIRTSDLKKIISGEQSIVSGFFNAQKKYEEYFKKYFFSYERNIAPQLNKALKDRYNKSSEDDLTRLMSDAHNDFLVYLFFRMQNIDPSLSSILAKDEDGNILTPKELMYSDNDNPSEVSKLYTALTAISKPKNNRRPIVDPKYSGITRSTAAMLLKLLDTQLNITDARLLKDGQGVDTQSTLVDLIKLGEKISSAPTVNKYIEMFEELRNNSPEVFKIFTSLSLFQSGISNSPYNLFKGMPNTTKTKDGIIDILAKTVIAYDKFIDNSVAAGVIEAPSGWTPQQIATATLINDFLRWYDVQYGSYLLESDRKAYHTTSKAYRKFDSSTLKYEVRVKKGEKPDKSDLVVSMGRSKYVREFFKNVDNTYTVSEVEDIQEDAVAALGVLERYAKNLIEAGVEVNKLCQ